jgi:hypothetical protein
MPREYQTLIVSVNEEDDEETRFQKILRRVGEGWRVINTTPVSGGDIGPGGESDDFVRLEVLLERDVDPGG